MSGVPLSERIRPSDPGFRWAIVALLACLASVAIGATIAARRIEAETARHLSDAPSPAAGEAEAAAIARAFERPRLATSLAGLAVHLPAGTPMAEAMRGRDGTLRIAIDTADPDELRALLGSEPWFADFHARKQEERAEGRMRVTLVEDRR